VPTARQKVDASRALRRLAERDRRASDRAALKRLRANLKHARKLRVQRMREIYEVCRVAKESLKHRAIAMRAATREKIEKLRASSRADCDRCKVKARERGTHSVTRAIAALEAEARHQKFMRLHAKPVRRVEPTRRRAADAIAESDSEVVNNIPHELVVVWEHVKGQIRGTPRRSRTEAFLEWVAENQPDVMTIMDRQFERDVDELERAEYELRQRVKSPRAYRRMSDRELAAHVPF
jgi:hypothetical protein